MPSGFCRLAGQLTFYLLCCFLRFTPLCHSKHFREITMKKRIALSFGISAALLTAVATRALVMTDSQGRWPSDWPKSLESLRDHARTIEVANGTQENIYEITFTDRAQFEKAWPTIISLKTPGAPLRLYKVEPVPQGGLGQLESNAAPIVRIYGPPEGEAIGPGGQKLKASAPWPRELYGPGGQLPEFVSAETVAGKLQWVKIDPEKNHAPGFLNRARVDVDLVVDGQVIDLNRIALPKDTPIEDDRF